MDLAGQPDSMTTGIDSSAGESKPDPQGPLRVELEIEPHEKANCAVASVDGPVSDVTQRVKGGEGGRLESRTECHSVVRTDGSSGEYVTAPVGSRCVCPAFERVDCIPEIEAVTRGVMIVSVTVPDRAALRDAVEAVRETGASVSLRKLERSGGASETSIEIDAAEITPKQREAIEIAVSDGYYDEPRETDLGELASQLGVSKSAVSQRLSAVEAKLVSSLVDGR